MLRFGRQHQEAVCAAHGHQPAGHLVTWRREGELLESRHTVRTFAIHAALHAPRDVQIVIIGTLLSNAAQHSERASGIEREGQRDLHLIGEGQLPAMPILLQIDIIGMLRQI